MKKITATLLASALTSTAFAYTEATATLQLSIVVHNLDGTTAPLVIANNNSGPLSFSNAQLHEIVYSGDLTADQQLHRTSVDMHAMCVSGLPVPGSNTSIDACTPAGLTGVWSAHGSTSEKAYLLAQGDATFSLTLLPGQTLSAQAQLYTTALNIGDSTDPGMAQFSIAGSFISVGPDAMAISAHTTETNSFSFSSTVYNTDPINKIVNVSLYAYINESNGNTIGNAAPVPEPSTWMMLAVGVLLLGRRFARLSSR